MSSDSIYQFDVNQINGENVNLGKYRDKVLLIVNTASECRFTPQLREMATLKENFTDENFEILAFPSNDFGAQEPLEGTALSGFCEMNYKTNYPLFSKIKVIGENAHPLYRFLSKKEMNGKLNSVPHWNFHKYLINRDGKVVDYLFSFTKPTSNKIKKAINGLL